MRGQCAPILFVHTLRYWFRVPATYARMKAETDIAFLACCNKQGLTVSAHPHIKL
jgi:hypothetical protein